MKERVSIKNIRARKSKTPLVVLTAYTAPVARLLDPHVDILLVGDSLGMVLYGMDNTRSVTLDMIIAHGKAVVKASSRAFVVVDMPFGSYEKSPKQALKNCQRVLKETGAQAVKLEGGASMAKTIALLTKNNIPVMGHVGLLPQSVTDASGYRYQGKIDSEAEKILADALAIQQADVFAIVIEAVPEKLAQRITKQLRVPIIGIGASPACDGQVLVIDDMLGMGGYIPSFVKEYAKLAPVIEKAVKAYASDVRKRKFPSAAYCFPFKK